MKRYIIIGLLVFLLIIQFVRPAKNNDVAETEKDYTHYVLASTEVTQVLKTACFDCHSNHTNYPWYSEIAPFSWYLNHHVEEGKAELNFSDFSQYEKKRMAHKLEEISEEVKEHEMPLSTYTLVHTEAKLSEAQIELLSSWAEREKAKLE